MLQPPQPEKTAEPFPLTPPSDPIAPLRAALRGHYDIERELGQGAFATVYLARDQKHDRKVAIKVLHADPASDKGELRFVREIRLLARLQHPNILPLHDSGHIENLLYYVMPYVRGDTLRDRIDRERQLPIESACAIARDVADALSYAHAQGIIHRDIKPENILLSTGHPILADFGIARAIDISGVRQLTRTGGESPGTPAYMSPEQLLGDKNVDGRSDIYGLACVLFEMLTGRAPFFGKEGFVKRFTEPPPKASSVRKDLPSWVDEVLEKALRREPEDRYASAKEFIVGLCAPEISQNSPALDRGYGHGAGHGWLESVLTPIRLHPKVAGGFLLALAATMSIGLTDRPITFFGSGVSLDTTRFVILPFAGPDRAGFRVSANIYEAFSGWQGAPIMADTRVAEAIRERGTPATEREAIALGKRLRAGKVVWGSVAGSSGAGVSSMTF